MTGHKPFKTMTKKASPIQRPLLVFPRSMGLKIAVFLTLIIALASWIVWPFPGLEGRAAEGVKTNISSGSFEHSYYARGSGQTIVLLASLGRPASDFNELTAAISTAGYRTVAIDLDTYRAAAIDAKSDLIQLAGRLDNVIKSLGLKEDEKVYILGHAFGNRLARAYASAYPNKIEAVVLLAAGGQIAIAPKIRQSLKNCFNPFLSKAIHTYALRHAFFAKESNIPAHWRIGWDRHLAAAQVHATEVTPFEKWWSAGDRPLLVIQGDADTIAPAAHTSVLLKEKYGDRVTVATASPAGHALLPEQPVFIASTIIAYLKARSTR